MFLQGIFEKMMDIFGNIVGFMYGNDCQSVFLRAFDKGDRLIYMCVNLRDISYGRFLEDSTENLRVFVKKSLEKRFSFCVIALI